MADPKRAGVTAAHSVVSFVFTVPDLAEAQRFYDSFGLDVRVFEDHLDLYTIGHTHRWGQVFANGKAKQLCYLSLGVYAEDLEPGVYFCRLTLNNEVFESFKLMVK